MQTQLSYGKQSTLTRYTCEAQNIYKAIQQANYRFKKETISILDTSSDR